MRYNIYSYVEDIDECNDPSLNDCPVDTTQCMNVFGNYTCECKDGYQKKNSECEGNIAHVDFQCLSLMLSR
jgi:hypothetical protein